MFMEAISVVMVVASIAVVVVLHQAYITDGVCVDPLKQSILEAAERSEEFQAFYREREEWQQSTAPRDDQEVTTGDGSPENKHTDCNGDSGSCLGHDDGLFSDESTTLVNAVGACSCSEDAEDWHCCTSDQGMEPPTVDDDDTPVTSFQRESPGRQDRGGGAGFSLGCDGRVFRCDRSASPLSTIL